MGILARLRLAKIRTMARLNSPDMPPKRTKKVRLGINMLLLSSNVVFLFLFFHGNVRFQHEVRYSESEEQQAL